MDFTNLLHTHKSSFLNLIRKEKLNLPVGHYSNLYSLKLANEIVTFRFKNRPGDSEYLVIFSNTSTKSKFRKPFIKKGNIYFFDKKLNKWLNIKEHDFYKSIEQIKIKSKENYLKLEHALSDTEKELLMMGKDLTTSFNVFTKNHSIIGKVTKNIVADYSFFLGSNSPIIKEKKENSKYLGIKKNEY